MPPGRRLEWSGPALEPVLPEDELSIAGIAGFVIAMLVLGLLAGAIGRPA